VTAGSVNWRGNSAAIQHQSGQTGFTLLEILVVVLMIGIMVSMATLMMGPSDNRVIEEEARRITYLLELAKDEAILDGKDMVLAVSERSYQFERFELDGALIPLSGDGVFKLRHLPENMELQIAFDGGEPILPAQPASESDPDEEEDAEKEEEEDPFERVFVSSTGEMAPFELTLRFRDKDIGYLLAGQANGDLTLTRLGEL
jgi:general secretion pathway protein H